MDRLFRLLVTYATIGVGVRLAAYVSLSDEPMAMALLEACLFTLLSLPLLAFLTLARRPVWQGMLLTSHTALFGFFAWSGFSMYTALRHNGVAEVTDGVITGYGYFRTILSIAVEAAAVTVSWFFASLLDRRFRVLSPPRPAQT